MEQLYRDRKSLIRRLDHMGDTMSDLELRGEENTQRYATLQVSYDEADKALLDIEVQIAGMERINAR